jgi:hypothetical protein
MGGYGNSSDFSNDDMDRLKKIAEEKLEALLAQSTKVLFACEQIDRRSLDSHLARSKVILKEKIITIDSTESEKADASLKAASMLVLFTNEAKTTVFLDSLIDPMLKLQKNGFHVKAHGAAILPTKVVAYRWRSVSWETLETFFRQ